jgi:hypothetical protein
MEPPELTKTDQKRSKNRLPTQKGGYKYGLLKLAILFANRVKKAFRQVIGSPSAGRSSGNRWATIGQFGGQSLGNDRAIWRAIWGQKKD